MCSDKNKHTSYVYVNEVQNNTPHFRYLSEFVAKETQIKIRNRDSERRS